MQAGSSAASIERHGRARIVGAILSAAVLAALIAAPAATLARGTGSGGTASTLTLSGTATFGVDANLVVVDPPVKSIQEVSVSCAHNGTQMYLDVHTQRYANWTRFTLWSQAWQDAGGVSAACTAQLFYYTWQGKTETGLVVEATTTFTTN